MGTVVIDGVTSEAVALPTSLTDAIEAAQAYALLAQNLLLETQQAALSAAEYATIAQAAATAATQITAVQIANYITSLPTTLPSSGGKVWLNGGVLSVS